MLRITRNPISLLALACVVLCTGLPALAADYDAPAGPLLRFPDIHGDLIVFVHGEDIWTVPSAGGVATRLTINDGSERQPKFSPDGGHIAFTGQYDGNTDIYVMDVHGGDITRVTFHPGVDEMVGWHPQNGKIIFRSARNSLSRSSKLFLINPDGSGLEAMVLHEAASGTFSSDGSLFAYNRMTREDRTWKRYRGGMAQDVWLFDFGKRTDRRLTLFDGTDRLPMLIGERIYFVSDREKTLNIFSCNLDGGDVDKITDHSLYDVRRPSMGGGKIVYELGGQLRVLDVQSGRDKAVAVEIRADVPDLRPVHIDVSDRISAIACAPDGAAALLTARGEVFTVPREDGRTVNLSRECGANDHQPVWSPDGTRIAWLSDRAGEYDLYVGAADGSGEARKLTTFADGYRHALRWSPDGRYIAFTDQTLTLQYIDMESGTITRVAKSNFENVDVSLHNKLISDYDWSPDSRWITYSKMDENLLYRVYVHNLKNGRNHLVSVDGYNDFNPVFSRDGRYLLFASNRRFDPVYCDFEWELVYKNTTGIYCLTLKAGDAPLLPPPGVVPAPATAVDEIKVEIDFNGLGERIQALPLEASNYRRLAAGDGCLFYLDADEGDFNRFEFRALPPRRLQSFSFGDREAHTVIDGVTDYALSADGGWIVWRNDGGVGFTAASAVDAPQTTLDLSAMRMDLDPRKEWRQIYTDAWRYERDFYYDPNMHGLDWQQMRRKYGRLVENAVCRQDVQYLIGELIGELNTSHTYSYPGDNRRNAVTVSVGMLGVDWEADTDSGFYRFGRILDRTEWTNEVMPPLVQPGVDIKEGEFLLAVDGSPVSTDRNVYSYFQDCADRPIVLTVNNRPEAKGARDVVVQPLGDETTLRYLDWVEFNRQVVDEASGGQIGYLHLPDTYNGSSREFPRQFYGQTRKKAIIVDGRFNNGGLDPDIFLQRLDKAIHSYWTRRHSHHQTTPAVVTRAHMACLTNHQAGSGGDMLPMEFQMREMGPVIGTRSWGGLVGVSQFLELIDGGHLTAPDYRIYAGDGSWIVEGVGVQPDIEVELDPMEMARGHDAQLMKAVEYLQQQIAADPRPWPNHAPIPVYK
jgi:tricorn protease